MSEGAKRKPRVFEIDDPALTEDEPQWLAGDTDTALARAADGTGEPEPVRRGGINWGALFLSALFGLVSLAIGMWFASLISSALAASGVIGWLATSLLVLLGVALTALIAREILGVMRLARLGDLRQRAEACTDTPDVAAERAIISEVAALYAGRPDMTWHLRKLKEHQGDVTDPGDLLKLADADLLASLDAKARQIILKSARRIAVVTALMPILLIDVIFVVFETMRMLRSLATLYGGRPGIIGAFKLGRMVFANLVAAGGIALTDDLIGQMFGQDMLRRLSHKLGEGAVNGTLCARIGVAAIGVVRPLPHLETPPVRLRDIVAELFKREAGESARPGEAGVGRA